MGLSGLGLRKAKGQDKPFRISDERAIVQPSGAMWWRFDYTIGGKRKTMSLGIYPDVPLADARTGRDEARALVAKGVDPVKEKRAAAKKQQAARATHSG